MSNLSPTQRTIRALKDRGRHYGIVERFIANPKLPHGFRQDLFGFIDIITMDTQRGIVGIQSCGQDFAKHYRKITEEIADLAIEWLNCGGKIELWGWRKIKLKRGGKAERWRPRIKDITYEDFKGVYEPNLYDEALP